jgi:four helix bundle protein
MYQVASIGREKISSFTQLNAWRKAHELVLKTYSICDSFPVSEQYGLTSQLKRAVVSITSNIAEGFSRRTRSDKIHFFHMALGSSTEVQNQILIARDLKYLPSSKFDKLASLSIEVNKLINGLIKTAGDKPL